MYIIDNSVHNTMQGVGSASMDVYQQCIVMYSHVKLYVHMASVSGSSSKTTDAQSG